MSQMSDLGSDTLKTKVRKVRALKAKALDEVRFLKSWIENPLKTGAVSPSGPALAARMASYLDVVPGARYVELGPGTGVVTKAIFDRGVSHKNLTALEYSSEFCKLLNSRYPGLDVLQGDAYALKGELEAHFGVAPDGLKAGLDGIVSSLPLLTRSEPARLALLEEAMTLLKPGAPFIQFSYGIFPPVRPACGTISVTPSEWIWKNLPPARVWVYRKIH